MLEVGAIETFQEAFDKYIGDDGPAYAARFRLTPQVAIDLIHSAGGVAVLAHPGRYEKPLAIAEEFVQYGLDGVEVFYPSHEPDLREQLLKLAERHHLIPTGGTDFHRPDDDGNIFIGDETVPYESVKALRHKATSLV
jgi:predicted metal-dependent phosphoesterase TrpH